MVKSHGSENPGRMQADSSLSASPWPERGLWPDRGGHFEKRLCPRCRQETSGPAGDSCPRCGFSFLETQATEGAPATNPAELVGRVINGKYRVLSVLGEGGFGVVYKVQLLLFDTANTFALKLLHPAISRDRTFRRRFLREAGLAMSLIHENTIQIREFGQTEDGQLFFTMDYCPGEPLKAVIQREGFLTVNRALHIARQILSVMRLAHARGIVHRDLKPENIFLEKDSSGKDFVKVGDFGLAKSFGSGDSGAGGGTNGGPVEEDITRGGIVGTPRYMAPEQALGKEDIDGRADIYSIGVVLYEMLYGQLPQETRPATRRSDPGLATLEVPAGSAHRVPQGVLELVRKATRWQREERFQSAQDFLDAIDALPEYAPVYVELKRKGRTAWRWFLLALVSAALVAAGFGLRRWGEMLQPFRPAATPASSEEKPAAALRAMAPKRVEGVPGLSIREFFCASPGDIVRYQTYREGMVPDREVIYEIAEESQPGRFTVKVTPGGRTFAWIVDTSQNALYQEFALPDPSSGELSEYVRRLVLFLPPGGLGSEDYVREDLRVCGRRVDLPVPGHPLYDVFRDCLCVQSRDGKRVRCEYYQEGRGLVAVFVFEPRPIAKAQGAASKPSDFATQVTCGLEPGTEFTVSYARYLVEYRSARNSGRN